MKHMWVIVLAALCLNGCDDHHQVSLLMQKAIEQDYLNKMSPPGYKFVGGIVQPREPGKELSGEYIPVNETAENWSEMITMSIMFGAGEIAGSTPERYLNYTIGIYNKTCSTVSVDGPKVGATGNYPNATLFLGCPMNLVTHKPDYTFWRVIKGQQNMYLIAKTFTFPPTPAQATEAWKYVNSIYICDSFLSPTPCPTTNMNPLTDNFTP